MRQHIGITMQFLTLVFLPLLILWQLEFGFPLIWMPGLLVVGILVFTICTRLRES
jgi:hypothetical protein